MLYICKAIGECLTAEGKTLCTAESCTGGRIAALITSVAGSSDYFRGGAVTYQTAIKSSVLKVPARLIERYGVVSTPTAREMCRRACRLFRADYAIAITGYAGPTGGTDADPVGTVYIAVGSETDIVTRRIVSNALTRTEIQDDVAACAIRLFAEYLNIQTSSYTADNHLDA